MPILPMWVFVKNSIVVLFKGRVQILLEIVPHLKKANVTVRKRNIVFRHFDSCSGQLILSLSVVLSVIKIGIL